MNTQKVLIEKLFEGKCSEEELIELLDSMKNADADNYENIMQKLWIELEGYPKLKNKHSDRILTNTLSKIHSDSNMNYAAKMINSKQPKIKWISRIAVAASIAIVAGCVMWNWQSSGIETITIATPYAETKTITLPDESVVELNAASQISYDTDWCETCDREVMLTGEAYFKVTKKERTGQKFRVVTADLTVEVLGTAFDVNTLHEQTQVFLEEGEIKLDLKEKPEEMLMVPGDVVTYSFQTKKKEKQQFNKYESIVWRNGMINMQNIPLSKILQKLEDIYGEKFSVINVDHMDRKFTVGIPVDDFETTLAVLNVVTKLSIDKNENLYVIK